MGRQSTGEQEARVPEGYWIVHITVTDPGNYPSYLAAVRAAFEKFDARFLVRGGRAKRF